MKDNLNFSFAIGYLAYLDSKLLDYKKLEDLKNCKTVKEFSAKLKNYGYHIENFETYEEFEEKIDNNFYKTMEEIKNICPKTKELNYIFCKNDFFNFKISLKNKFSQGTQSNLNFLPGIIEPQIIIKCLETRNFEELKKPYKKAFEEIFHIFLKTQDIKQTEIFADRKTYELLLYFAKKNEFLTERTKLEITLKNINFCIRFLKYSTNLKYLESCLIENGIIEKEKILKAAEKNNIKFYDILKDINLKIEPSNAKKTDEIYTNILEKFDEGYILNQFSISPILTFTERLKKEIIFLKTIMIKLILNFEKR